LTYIYIYISCWTRLGEAKFIGQADTKSRSTTVCGGTHAEVRGAGRNFTGCVGNNVTYRLGKPHGSRLRVLTESVSPIESVIHNHAIAVE